MLPNYLSIFLPSSLASRGRHTHGWARPVGDADHRRTCRGWENRLLQRRLALAPRTSSRAWTRLREFVTRTSSSIPYEPSFDRLSSLSLPLLPPNLTLPAVHPAAGRIGGCIALASTISAITTWTRMRSARSVLVPIHHKHPSATYGCASLRITSTSR